jgi:hypothetical protein
MEKIKIEREAIVLDADEKVKLMGCLQYCKHRLINHPESGIHRFLCDIKFVDYVIKKLE